MEQTENNLMQKFICQNQSQENTQGLVEKLRNLEKCPKCKYMIEDLSNCKYCLEEIEKVFLQTIPKKFKSFKAFNPSLVSDFLKSSRGGFFYGSAGTGKTTFLCTLLFSLLVKFKVRTEFVYSTSLAFDLQDAFRKEVERTPKIILSHYANVDILGIDDLGAEKTTDYIRQAFNYLITMREANEKRTFITSNLDLNGIDSVFESRISSRIAGMCEVIEFTGKDRRLEK